MLTALCQFLRAEATVPIPCPPKSCFVGETLMLGISPLWVAAARIADVKPQIFNLALESLLANSNLMRTEKVLQRCSNGILNEGTSALGQQLPAIPYGCHHQPWASRVSLRPSGLTNPIKKPSYFIGEGALPFYPPFAVALGGLTTLDFRLKTC